MSNLAIKTAKRSLGVLAVAVCLCALVLQSQAVRSAFRRNLWSRQVAPGLVQPGAQGSELPPIPAEYPRAADWQALSRLKAGRADLALGSLAAATGGQPSDGLSSGILAISLEARRAI